MDTIIGKRKNMSNIMEKSPMHVYGKNIVDLIVWLIYTHFVSKIPYSIGVKMRKAITKRLFKEVEGSTSISTNVKLLCPQQICIGKRVGITHNVTLDGWGG